MKLRNLKLQILKKNMLAVIKACVSTPFLTHDT